MNNGWRSWCWLSVPALVVLVAVASVSWLDLENSEAECDDTSFAQKHFVLSRLITGQHRQALLNVPTVPLDEPADLMVEDGRAVGIIGMEASIVEKVEPALIQTRSRGIVGKVVSYIQRGRAHQESLPGVGDIVGADPEVQGMERPGPSVEAGIVLKDPFTNSSTLKDVLEAKKVSGTKPWGSSSRYRKPEWEHHKSSSMRNFFTSGAAEEWAVVGAILVCCVLVQYTIMEWPSKHFYHSIALLIWFGIAAACNVLILWRFGKATASNWFSGYMLELVFSVENIFVFHIVARAFRVPRRHAQKALMYVVVAQIIFEMVFFMGLAYAIRSSQALPYILGVWLIYVGYQAGSEHPHGDVDFKDTWVYSWSQSILGDRLFTKYPKKDVSMIIFRDGEKKNQVTLLFLATMALIIVDFLLEVDVVLTKIEEIDNHFISFTSSAAAAFAIPELFFICRDLFARFYLMKFGICLILVFFGVQLLFMEVLELSTTLQIVITLVIMAICMVLSMLLPAQSSDLDADEEDYEPQTSDGEQ